MRPIVPLVAVVLLAGCDDGAEPAASAGTVAVGSLPAAVATTAAVTVPSTEAPPPTTASPASTAPPAATRFVEVLGRLVEDGPPPARATNPLLDDTGRLQLDVPEEWSDRRTSPSRLADGTQTPALAAAPDLTAFLDGFDTPGVTALVVADAPGAALAAYTFGESCRAGDTGPYRAAGRRGRYAVWESCGGTFNDIVTVAVQPPEADESVLLLVQVVGAADLAALDIALDSLALG